MNEAIDNDLPSISCDAASMVSFFLPRPPLDDLRFIKSDFLWRPRPFLVLTAAGVAGVSVRVVFGRLGPV